MRARVRVTVRVRVRVRVKLGLTHVQAQVCDVLPSETAPSPSATDLPRCAAASADLVRLGV